MSDTPGLDLIEVYRGLSARPGWTMGEIIPVPAAHESWQFGMVSDLGVSYTVTVTAVVPPTAPPLGGIGPEGAHVG